MNKRSIEDIQDLKGKRVLMRVDFNVPMDKETGEITDETRIMGALPSIKYLYEHGAKVILCSHLGRPKGEFNMKFSLAPVAKRLGELVDTKVIMAKDVVGEDAKKCVAEMKDGEIVVLENVRFHNEETKNDPALSKELASLADVYVNDAFGTAHRAHASTAGCADYLPAYCGYLIEKEVSVMGKALEDPERPFVAILGGAKVKDKIGVITNLLEKVDTLIIGGGMAFTFLKAKGYGIGDSLLDEENVSYCQGSDGQSREKRREAADPGGYRGRQRVCRGCGKQSGCRRTRSRTAGRAWILGLRPANCLAMRLRVPRPWFGTGRWAYLNLKRLQTAPKRWPRPWQNPRLPPSSAAATAQRRLSSWAMRIR